jgi:hypothetical protein
LVGVKRAREAREGLGLDAVSPVGCVMTLVEQREVQVNTFAAELLACGLCTPHFMASCTRGKPEQEPFIGDVGPSRAARTGCLVAGCAFSGRPARPAVRQPPGAVAASACAQP